MEEGKGGSLGPRFIPFPFPSSPTRFLFSLSPASLRHKKASAEETGWPSKTDSSPLELMSERADRASEQTKMRKKTWQVLEGN